MTVIFRPITALGVVVLDLIEFIGGLGYLLFDTLVASRQVLFSRRGWKFAWGHLWDQMNRVGVKSIPIVSLVMVCIGAILALQMAPVLRDFGLVAFVADIVSIAVFRELGPLISAVVSDRVCGGFDCGRTGDDGGVGGN